MLCRVYGVGLIELQTTLRCRAGGQSLLIRDRVWDTQMPRRFRGFILALKAVGDKSWGLRVGIESVV